MSKKATENDAGPSAAVTPPPAHAGRDSLRWWGTGVICVLLTAVVVLIVDRLVGIAFPSLHSALLASAGTAARYNTVEFDVTAHNNALGLRGAEMRAARSPGVKRIVALGDSFTWGWGVPDHAAWPAVLERLLNESGLRVEVANAGQAGADPSLYAKNARRVIPILKPDLILVGVLQGDDIEQLRNTPTQKSVSARIVKVCRELLPNMTGLAKRLVTWRNPVADIKPVWRREARSILKAMSKDQRGRYAVLEPGVRFAFEDGRLNPFLVQIALRQPDYFVDATRKDGLAVPQGVMADNLRDLAVLAAAHGSKLVIVAVPYPVYVSKAGLEAQRRIGFELNERLLTSDVPDLAIQEACDRAGVPCVTVSSMFRDRCARGALFFFPLDGHLNEAGHRCLAEQLLPITEQRLDGTR